MRMHRSRLFGAILAVAVAGGGWAHAADPASLDTSLKLVPADAAFYTTSLRLGEQFDRFLTSNAFARLKDLPAVKFALEQAHQEMTKPGNPLGQLMTALHEPANRQLVDLLRDLGRTEVFCYGSARWADLAALGLELGNSVRFAPAMAALRGEDPNRAQVQALLSALATHGDKLKVPDLVIGFKLSQTEPAVAQIKRLEDLLLKVTANGPLKRRVIRRQVAGVSALTIGVDGSLIPWDQIPLDENAADIRKVFQRLKSLTLTAALLVKGNYLLLAIGPDATAADSFGRGPALATRPEFKPLEKFGSKPLIAVGYTSRALAAAVATTSEDIGGIANLAKSALARAPLKEHRRTAIEKDLNELAKDISAKLPAPTASFSCSFLTPHGQETYAYEYSPAPSGTAAPLAILDHVGGAPLIVIAGHTGDSTASYRSLARWLKAMYAHVEGIIQEQFGDDQLKQFKVVMDQVAPLLKRFDGITGNQWLPALGAGQTAFVIDAKWTSKNWMNGLDQHGVALPLPEVGCVRTVKNSAQVLEALQAYRTLANDVLAKARALGAPIPPEVNLPPAESKAVAGGTAYFWRIPSHGQDAQIQPNLGLSDQALAVSLSLGHTERLLKRTPAASGDMSLDSKRPVLTAGAVDFAGLIGTARPWIEQLALPAILMNAPDNAPPGLAKKDIPDQVKTVLDVLQCVRGVRVMVYREDSATVTHSELVIRDLP